MAAGKTYEPIATITFSGSSSTGTFSSIPSAYTDIDVVFTGTSSAQALCLRFNNDTGTNYSKTAIKGDGSSATSYRNTNIDRYIIGSIGTTPTFEKVTIFSYAGSTYKTCLDNSNEDANGSGNVVNGVGLWRSTSAINSITIFGYSGSNLTGTATLYGIKAA